MTIWWIIPGVFVLLSLVAGLNVGFKYVPRILRNVRIQVVVYGSLRVLGMLTETRARRTAFSLVVAIPIGVLIWVEAPCHAWIVLLGAVAVYQTSRRAEREAKWRSMIARIGYALNKNPELFEHQFLKSTYFIGSDSLDRWMRHSSIKANEPMIRVKGIRVGAQGEGVPRIQQFWRLAVSAWSNKGGVIVIPGEHQDIDEGGTHDLQLILTEPIQKDEERQLMVAGAWRDMWAPLRATGRDQGSMSLIRQVKTLEIEVVFPRGIGNASMKRKSHAGNAGKVNSHLDDQERLHLVWHIQEAEPGQYEYEIECTEMRQ